MMINLVIEKHTRIKVAAACGVSVGYACRVVKLHSKLGVNDKTDIGLLRTKWRYPACWLDNDDDNEAGGGLWFSSILSVTAVVAVVTVIVAVASLKSMLFFSWFWSSIVFDNDDDDEHVIVEILESKA